MHVDHVNSDKSNYKIVKVSKVNDKMIYKLINNLKLGLSEDFFISFESLLKLGKRAKSAIETQYNHMDDDHNFRKEIFNFLLNCMDEDIANPPLERLYHPDFIIRANSIMQLEREDSLKYLNLILPLISDPDDSVRYAVVKLIDSLNQVNNPHIYKRLQIRVEIESNPVIQKKNRKYFK